MTTNTSPIPVLVLGANRSGTKWLSNMLCNHPDISGIQSAEHFGIIETNMLGKFQEIFGDLSTPENFIALMETWSATDFFKTTRVSKETIYRLDPWPTCYTELFRMVMDEHAQADGCGYWLQKLSALQIKNLGQLVDDAKLVVIRRDLIPNVASTLRLLERRNIRQPLFRLTLNYALQSRLLAKASKLSNALAVRYEDLTQDSTNELKRICDFLGLDFSNKMIELQFGQNSSFDSDAARQDQTLTSFQQFLVKSYYLCSCLLPTAALERLHKGFRNKTPTFIHGTFRGIQNRNRHS